MIWNQAHSVSLHRSNRSVCVHVCTTRSWMHWHFLHRHASRAQPRFIQKPLLLLENTQNCTTQHTWAPSFTDSQHQVRKEMLFHGEFSFSNKSKGNSGLCCGLTRRNSQTPQMRLHLRAKEREHYYYDCKSEWMNRASSYPHITLLVLCLAWVWVATVLYIQGDVFHQTVATYVQICIVLFVLCLL